MEKVRAALHGAEARWVGAAPQFQLGGLLLFLQFTVWRRLERLLDCPATAHFYKLRLYPIGISDMSEMSRLRWACRRGMKELDVAMTAYLEKFYQKADADDQAAFLRLIDTQDPELMNMVMGKISAPDEQMERVLQTIRRAVTA